jgi:hypothetical protein
MHAHWLEAYHAAVRFFDAQLKERAGGFAASHD